MRSLCTMVHTILHTHDDWRMTLIARWPHIVGDVAAHACIEKIDGETLFVGVHNAAWLQELYLLAPMLQRNINQALDQPRIKQIRFRYHHPQTVTQRKITHSIARTLVKRPLNPKEQRALNTIHDKELSSQLYHFLLRCQQAKT